MNEPKFSRFVLCRQASVFARATFVGPNRASIATHVKNSVAFARANGGGQRHAEPLSGLFGLPYSAGSDRLKAYAEELAIDAQAALGVSASAFEQAKDSTGVEGMAARDQCGRCGDPRESTVHMTDSKNTDIRMGAHAFVLDGSPWLL